MPPPMMYEAQQQQHQWEVWVLFLHMDKHHESIWWNKVAACYQRSTIIHTEIFFNHPYREDMRVTFSISTNYPAGFWAKRQYTREDLGTATSPWEAFKIVVTPESYNKMIDFCSAHQNDKFDSFSLYFFMCACYAEERGNRKWLCSWLVAAILQAGFVLEVNMDPFRETPESLRQRLHAITWNVQHSNRHTSAASVLSIQYEDQL